MNLEVTVCSSILEYCFSNLNYYDKNNTAKKVLDEIQSRRMVIHADLEESYAEFFENQRPDLVDHYREFIKQTLTYAESVKILGSYADNANTVILNNRYLKLLTDVCLATHDKILFSDLFSAYVTYINQWGVNWFNRKTMVDRQNSNSILNQYRLPLIRKVVRRGNSSNALSVWMSKFLNGENSLTIIDGYLYENSDNFYRYFLRHVPNGATIKLYTLKNGRTNSAIIRKFRSAPFNNWNFEIELILSKKDQHARDIFTSKYYIEIDKGMGVFGTSGRTHQANITIQDIDNIYDSCLPTSTQKII